MILAIDIGNSRIKIAFCGEEGKVTFITSLKIDKNNSADECAIRLLNSFMLHKADITTVTGTIISSVVPPMTPPMSHAIFSLTGKQPIVVGPGTKTGLNIKTELHGQLGTDIVASAVGAIAKYTAPILIIDMGTASTFSYINSKLEFLGCSIFPGVRTSLEALSERAAQLPYISIDTPGSVTGRNTVESMRAGIVYGSAGMVDSMIARFEEEEGPLKTIVATGGNANLIVPYCKREMIYDANLLFDGLNLIYNKNVIKAIK